MIPAMVWASLVIVALAVARVTRLVTTDRITLFLRRWVVNKWGEESEIAFLLHCPWCSSIWIAFPAGVIWAVLMLPLQQWWLAIPAWLAMSYVTGLISQLEER
jgi:hypothetical protein